MTPDERAHANHAAACAQAMADIAAHVPGPPDEAEPRVVRGLGGDDGGEEDVAPPTGLE